jgi:hypothetical protein
LVLYFILNFLTWAESIAFGKDKKDAKIECLSTACLDERNTEARG